MSYKKHILIILIAVVISLLHYLTPTHLHHFHAIFQRLYYIPIILSAYFFGLRLTLAYAFLCGILYMPHIFFQWSFDASHSFTQYVEISMFFVVASLLGILFEIRRQQAQKILRQQKELAREKRLGLLGKLAAGLAHEIRNPLGGLLGSAEILRDELGKEHPQLEFVNIIETELKRVNKKLNEFLNFARPRPPELIPNNINDIIRSVIQLLKPDAEKAGIGIIDNLQKDIPLVAIDTELVKQIILNVLLNSLHFLKEGGVLTVMSSYSGSWVTVTFADDGPGIAPDDMESIFEPFYSKRESGTGLGLSISRQLAKQHGGNLRALVRENGACFELRIPDGKKRA